MGGGGGGGGGLEAVGLTEIYLYQRRSRRSRGLQE